VAVSVTGVAVGTVAVAEGVTGVAVKVGEGVTVGVGERVGVYVAVGGWALWRVIRGLTHNP
jgi:hypothetical protein